MSNFQKDVQLLADLQGLIEKREKQVNPPEGSTAIMGAISPVLQAVEAGRISAERTAKDAFKATERRLYGLPTLKIKLEDDLERLEEFKLYGPRERSKSITRFIKNGNRLSPDEIWEAVLMDMEATIAADRYEIETLERALATVRDDPYYRALSGKYLDDVDDRDIAEDLECDTSTVWRHRKRLVQRVAVWLYGAEALR